jgi:hypothetical protein
MSFFSQRVDHLAASPLLQIIVDGALLAAGVIGATKP